MRSKDVSISLKEIGNRVMTNNEEALVAAGAHSSPVSPPPFMVGMAEVEVDKETGKVELIDYAAVVDCGTVVNAKPCPHTDRRWNCTGNRYGSV